jgi:hypothetical protein
MLGTILKEYKQFQSLNHASEKKIQLVVFSIFLFQLQKIIQQQCYV